jgi:hypothetical protein
MEYGGCKMDKMKSIFYRIIQNGRLHLPSYILHLTLALCALPSFAEDYSMQIQMLESEIRTLQREKTDKTTSLEKCAKSVKGFQIAGGVTLGLTAVGIAGNVAQAVNLKKIDNKIEAENERIASEKKAAEAAAAEKLAQEKAAQEKLAADKADCDKKTTHEWKEDKCMERESVNGNEQNERPANTPVNPTKPNQEETEKKCSGNQTQECWIETSADCETRENGKCKGTQACKSDGTFDICNILLKKVEISAKPFEGGQPCDPEGSIKSIPNAVAGVYEKTGPVSVKCKITKCKTGYKPSSDGAKCDLEKLPAKKQCELTENGKHLLYDSGKVENCTRRGIPDGTMTCGSDGQWSECQAKPITTECNPRSPTAYKNCEILNANSAARYCTAQGTFGPCELSRGDKPCNDGFKPSANRQACDKIPELELKPAVSQPAVQDKTRNVQNQYIAPAANTISVQNFKKICKDNKYNISVNDKVCTIMAGQIAGGNPASSCAAVCALTFNRAANIGYSVNPANSACFCNLK